jgi:hypothetical protein
MKKIILIAALAGTAMVACKKDRVCSCKEVDSISPVTPPASATVVTNWEYTMVKTGWRAGYNHCTHTKQTVVTGSVTTQIDINCSLK